MEYTINNKWDLMITSAIMHNYILKSPIENLWDKNLSYIGLLIGFLFSGYFELTNLFIF